MSRVYRTIPLQSRFQFFTHMHLLAPTQRYFYADYHLELPNTRSFSNINAPTFHPQQCNSHSLDSWPLPPSCLLYQRQTNTTVGTYSRDRSPLVRQTLSTATAPILSPFARPDQTATKRSSSAPSPMAHTVTSQRTRFEPTTTVTVRLTGNFSAISAEPRSMSVTKEG